MRQNAAPSFSVDYTGQTFTTVFMPPLLELEQDVSVPTSGTQWRLTLTISGMNDQTNLPPRFIAQLGGVPSQVFLPDTTFVGSSGGKLIPLATLTTGNTLTLDFTAALNAGDVMQLILDNVPIFTESADNASGVGLQKFSVTNATLIRTQ